MAYPAWSVLKALLFSAYRSNSASGLWRERASVVEL